MALVSSRKFCYAFNAAIILGEAMLACGTSDGAVTVLTVQRVLTSKPGATQLVTMHEVGLGVSLHDEKACDADGRAITGMRWADTAGRNVSFSSQYCGLRLIT